jgi:hypothetical protein
MNRSGRDPAHERWQRMSESAKEEAQQLPHGEERDLLVRKARQLETAAHIEEWLTSPGLRPPE